MRVGYCGTVPHRRHPHSGPELCRTYRNLPVQNHQHPRPQCSCSQHLQTVDRRLGEVDQSSLLPTSFDRLWSDADVILRSRADADAWQPVLAPMSPVLDPNRLLDGGIPMLTQLAALTLHGEIWSGAFRSVDPSNIPEYLTPPGATLMPMSRKFHIESRERLVAPTSHSGPVKILRWSIKTS